MHLLIGHRLFAHLFMICSPVSVLKGDKAQIEVYDPNGNPSSLLYDGGRIRVICDYDIGNSTENRSLIIKNDQLHTERMLLADVNHSEIRYDQSISHRILNTTYSCRHGSRFVGNITISYILCNPAVMPQIDCLEPKEHCQITYGGSAECSQLIPKNCLSLKVFPKWQRFDTINSESEKGLCRGLSAFDESDIITVGDSGRVLAFYLVANNPPKRQQLYVNRWAYIDLRYQYTVYAKVYEPEYVNLITVNATVNGVLISSFNTSKLIQSIINLTTLVDDLKHLNRPARVFMTCYRINVGAPQSRHSAQLMVFDSSKHLRSRITEEHLGTANNKSINKLHINVTAASGLYVCVKEGKDKCIPTDPSNSESLEVIVAIKKGDHNVATFYIGLFASSPHRRYVLVHDRIVKHTITGHGRKTVKSHAAEHSSDTRVIAGFSALVVISTILAVVAVVMAVLWKRSTERYKEKLMETEHRVNRNLGVPSPKRKTSLDDSRTEFFTYRKSSIQSSTL